MVAGNMRGQTYPNRTQGGCRAHSLCVLCHQGSGSARTDRCLLAVLASPSFVSLRFGYRPSSDDALLLDACSCSTHMIPLPSQRVACFPCHKLAMPVPGLRFATTTPAVPYLALLKLTPCLPPPALNTRPGTTRSRTGASYDPVGVVSRTPRRAMHRQPGTQRPGLRVARAATSAVALCGFLGRAGKGVNAFTFSSCTHRRACSLPSTTSRSRACMSAGQGMRPAGGQGALRPTLSGISRRSARGGLLQLSSSEEDGEAEEAEEAAREEVRPYLFPRYAVCSGRDCCLQIAS